MGTYRLYCLDGAGKVLSAEWIDAEDDDTAIEAAKDMVDGHQCELWARSRFDIRLPKKHG